MGRLSDAIHQYEELVSTTVERGPLGTFTVILAMDEMVHLQRILHPDLGPEPRDVGERLDAAIGRYRGLDSVSAHPRLPLGLDFMLTLNGDQAHRLSAVLEPRSVSPPVDG